MNIFNFTEQKDNDKEYKYKVLVYPNITYMKDLEKDSYVVVLRNVIKELNKVRDDIHWTILSPYEVKSLIFPNTTQLPIELPSYPNAMRTHFNHKKLMKTIDWKKNDYDVVYTHLPEHTLQLSNMFANETNQVFTPTSNGNYAVEVAENGCVDTSDCYAITTVGMKVIENDFMNQLAMYPNPTSQDFTLDLGAKYEKISITITDVSGVIIKRSTYHYSQLLSLNIQAQNGIYFLTVRSEKEQAIIKVIIE